VTESLAELAAKRAANSALDFQSKNPELMLYRVWSAGANSNVGASYIPNQAWAESLRRPTTETWANRYAGNTHGASNMPVEHLEDELRRYMGVTPNAEFMWRPGAGRAPACTVPGRMDARLPCPTTGVTVIEAEALLC